MSANTFAYETRELKFVVKECWIWTRYWISNRTGTIIPKMILTFPGCGLQDCHGGSRPG